MTAEVVFNPSKRRRQLTDEYRISENAWRKGARRRAARPCWPCNSKVSVDDLLHGALIQSGNDACIALAEGDGR